MRESLPDDWMVDGRCVGESPDFFDDAQTEVCRAMCRECPVRFVCRWFGFVEYEQFGMWGGWSRGDRVRYRKENRGFRRDHARRAFGIRYAEYKARKDPSGSSGGDG